MEHEFHREMIIDVATMYATVGWNVFLGIRLPNNKIPDIVMLNRERTVWIIEVKTLCRPGYLQDALDKYGDYATYLSVAMPCEEDAIAWTSEDWTCWPNSVQRVGVLGVHRRKVQVLRHAAPAQHRRRISLPVFERTA